MSKSLSDCCKNMNNLRERPIPPHSKGWGLLGPRVENKIIWHDIDLERAKEQIKSLQSALVKERFQAIWRESKHDDVAKVTELAKKQLMAEMPEEMT